VTIEASKKRSKSKKLTKRPVHKPSVPSMPTYEEQEPRKLDSPSMISNLNILGSIPSNSESHVILRNKANAESGQDI
jgi:hypothetical protein